MSGLTFRVGDVVETCNGPRRVTCVEAQYIGTDDGWFHATHPAAPELPLLRRPVRAGDTLRKDEWDWTFTVTRIAPVDGGADIGIFGRDVGQRGETLKCRPSDLRRGWTHADGTPIEPPQAEAEHDNTGAPEPHGPDRICATEPAGLLYGIARADVPLQGQMAQAIQNAHVMQGALASQQQSARHQEQWHAEMQAAQQRLQAEWSRSRAMYAPPPEPAPPPLPDVDELARALFETDARVINLIFHCADAWIMRDGEQIHDEARERAALDKAWDRDDICARTEAEQRAEAVLDVLRRRA